MYLCKIPVCFEINNKDTLRRTQAIYVKVYHFFYVKAYVNIIFYLLYNQGPLQLNYQYVVCMKIRFP